MSTPNTPIPEVKKREIVHHGFFDLCVDELHLPHGPTRSYYVLNIHSHAAAILAITTDGKFIINKEYRHPTRQWLLSCPGGRIDPGESPLEAAKRELLEETGYGNGAFSLLGSLYPFPAVTDQKIFYVLAKGVKFVQPPALEEFELIHPQEMTETELEREIISGNPVDGILCTALMLKKLKGSGVGD